MVTVERGKVLRHEVVQLSADGDTLEIPLTGEEAPNVYLSVTLLGQTQDGRPDFRQGYLNLPVEPLEQTFNVQVESQPPQTGPGEDVYAGDPGERRCRCTGAGRVLALGGG